MFKFEKNPVFTWPVKVQVPTDGGKFEEHVFNARWQLQDAAALRKFQDEHPAGGAVALLEKALKGWSDIQEADGNSIEFTPENVKRLADTWHVRSALVASYWDAANGELRTKN